jgi:nicotinamidase-related amidase
MSVTMLDPKTALVLIDLQRGIVGLPAVHPIRDILGRASLLASTFRNRSLPVVLVTVEQRGPSGRTDHPSRVTEMLAGWADLVPELDAQPRDHRITKQTWGAFTNTGLEQLLKTQGVTQIVLAGVATSIGVESTARHARELGFNVTLAIDAMTDLNLDAHINSVTRIFPRLGETGTTEDIVALFDKASA